MHFNEIHVVEMNRVSSFNTEFLYVFPENTRKTAGKLK